jgi:acetyltransferase-like isoleucine patch superfamily enzyme
MRDSLGSKAWNLAAFLRVSWTVTTIAIVEAVVFAVALLPAASLLGWLLSPLRLFPDWLRLLALGLSVIPAYLLFAVLLMILSALSTSITGWRTPRHCEMKITDLEWPLLNWVRYAVSIHIVKIFAGVLLGTTPLWTAYMRMNGARLGRGVFVNSLAVSDHCLLEFGDNVIIGGGVHLSGHTVEKGRVKTAPVKLGRGVTIGVGAVVGIGVEAGPGCQIGALSLVPKFARLEAHSTYVGIPARKIKSEPTTTGC